MAFNKNKALENALKFLNQGKVAQAIAEYQQILRHDPKDQATLMTVGDLYARQADLAHAIEYFERLAQVYLNDGFNSKAIAIYKKIAKLAPSELPPLERLADLYVQQGILSEARPLFLQIAESHLKANRAQKAVEVLHRLLEVEPENLRVQMRLAELYNLMGQKKEAAQTYLAYAQRLFERGEKEEAEKLIERCLEADPSNAAALLLKAKALNANNKTAEAVPILEAHPEANAGGDVTTMLVDYELRAGQTDKAVERGRSMLAVGHAHYGFLYKAAEKVIDSEQPKAALRLIQELRAPMIEAGEQDKFLKLLTAASERLAGETEPLEMLADFCRTTSDPFRLNATLGQLSDAYAAAGNFPRAEELLQELVDRNKDDERIVERLNALRARTGGAPMPAAEAAPPETQEEKDARRVPQAAVTAAPVAEEALDEETQRYVAQALTDVDLFSSYGLTQKATHLLENVLQRAPRHTPTLERLLDLYLGAGNEQRTAELAGQLEQIHRDRNDQVNADRFAELRQRFQKTGGAEGPVAAADTLAAPEVAAVPPTVEAASEGAVPVDENRELSAEDIAAEFGIPLATAPPVPVVSAPVVEEFTVAPVPVEEPEIALESSVPATAEPEPVTAGEELDLSDEWEAISQDVADAEKSVAEEVPLVAEAPSETAIEPEMEATVEPILELEAEPTSGVTAEPESEPAFVLDDSDATPSVEPSPIELEHEAPLALEIAPEPEEVRASSGEVGVQPDVFEIQESTEEVGETPVVELVEEPAFELLPEEPAGATTGEFELELAGESAVVEKQQGPATTEDFLSELAAEVEDLEAPSEDSVLASIPQDDKEPLPYAVASSAPAAARTENGNSKSAAGKSSSTVSGAPPEITEESLNELAEVFQEFRSELGELGEEDEDLETHYNLGIAYREMGLLDEAIGEFQKVAKAVQKGKPFRYTMNCSTMLGLSFMDKGEPNIAALWYRRALEVPGLEDETVLALRYDLGLALDAAGDSSAALDCFRQVYATNIEYRDVADRISTLQRR
ncbi:MAG: tetratricopeptide repeat protein [Candidatus Acidiferrales bacterium]|jgi:tetratricopeptide (TPR) repeat protein